MNSEFFKKIHLTFLEFHKNVPRTVRLQNLFTTGHTGGFGMETVFLDCVLLVISVERTKQTLCGNSIKIFYTQGCSEITIVPTNISGLSWWIHFLVNQWLYMHCFYTEHLVLYWDRVGKAGVPVQNKGLRILIRGTCETLVNRNVTKWLYYQLWNGSVSVVVGVSSWPWFTWTDMLDP